MKTFLDFLNSEDRSLLLSKSSRHNFTDGQTILKQGDKNTALHIIVSGDASIISRTNEFELEVGQLHQEDVLGEMSFVDNEPVSSDVVAIGDVAIDVIAGKNIQTIIRQDPMFYGRFFHAISKVLSRRMRSERLRAEYYLVA